MKKFLGMILALAVLAVGSVGMAQFRGSVAQVDVEDVGNGNAFFVEEGLLMTAAHVVKDAKIVKLKYSSFWIYGKVVAKDVLHDLALIRINGTGNRPFEFCKVDKGERVSMWSYRRGKFRRVRGQVKWVKPEYIRTSITVARGNSGSPTVQSRCVIGVVVAGRASDMAGGHVPASVAKQFLNQYLAGAAVK